MLKTIEEVKKGLECCKYSRQNVKPNRCDECPYKDEGVMNYSTVWKTCSNRLSQDALIMINTLERDVKYYKNNGGQDADKT